MLTDWDTIEEAESMIAYDDLKAYYVHIAGKPVCLIADADQDISGISRRIPIINEITDAFSLPTYIEAGTPYEGLINELNQPTFSEIRNLSVDYVNTHRDKLDTLFDKLNHGVNILKTQDELYAYMYCFGKMHEAKLIKAFDAIPRTFFKANKEIEVIDYACGQGLATLCLNDYIEELYDITIKRITLIDPSKKALSRAALHCHKVIPEAVIDTLLTTFDDLDYGEIPTTKLQRVHLLSNILDMDCYDLGNLADIIQDIVNSGDMFVCVDPWFHDIRLDRRQQRLMRLLSGKKIYHEAFNSGELASNKTWTAYITVFKV
jgi:SAM-dependent methyltransferase